MKFLVSVNFAYTLCETCSWSLQKKMNCKKMFKNPDLHQTTHNFLN